MYSGTLTALEHFMEDASNTDLINETAAINRAERTAQPVTVTNSNDITTTYEQQGFPLGHTAPCD
ncbi:hypothetical protein [Pontimicrobium sp. MEBiC01747]